VANTGVVITSKWIYPVTSKPIHEGALVIRGKRIEAVGDHKSILSEFKDLEVKDFGDAIVVPGLINLHSHLDYAALGHLETDAALFDWIPMLMKSVSTWSPDDFFQSGLFGARLNALAGTTFIVDSSYSGKSAEAIAASGLKGMVGVELFGLDKNTVAATFQAWQDRLAVLIDNCSPELKEAISEGRVTLTCSPHAPYTVCPQLWQEAKKWSEAHQLPLLAHMAESNAECRWLMRDDEVINGFLRKVMPSNKDRDTEAILKAIDWKFDGLSPVAFLHKHGLLSRGLVAAHSIHVDDDDIKVLKETGVSVAHCPRSNARLRNGRAPLPGYLKAGVNAGLGTDGLPSTDSLDLLDEARFAVNMHRAVDPECTIRSADLIELMTMGAARAIGFDQSVGSLDAGKCADVSVFKIAPDHPRTTAKTINDSDPADLLIRFPTKIEAVFVDGKMVVEAGRLRNN